MLLLQVLKEPLGHKWRQLLTYSKEIKKMDFWLQILGSWQIWAQFEKVQIYFETLD